ncbi:transmembrane 220 family protein [Wenyingzhuangia sp. IMCC45467]
MSIKLSKRNIIINSLLFLMFMAFAVLQLNDPDPIIWFTIYFVIAIICLLINFISINNKIIYGYIVLLIIYAGFHFSYLIDWLHTNEKEEIFGKMVYEKPYLEGSREFIGLAMGIAGLIFTTTTNRK